MFKKRLPLILLILFLILFFFLFPKRTGPDMVLVPEFLPLDENLTLSFEDETIWLPTEHYIYSMDSQDKQQRILPRDKNSSAEGNFAVISGSDQSYLYALKEDPVVWDGLEQVYTENNRIVSFDMYRSITEWDSRRNKLWSRSLPSALSSISLGTSRMVLGFMDGSIQILDNQGQLIQEYRPGGSRVEIIYAVALSVDESSIALISGLSPQRFLVLEQKQNDYRPVFHENLDTQYRRPILLAHSAKNNTFYFETETGVALFYLDTQVLEELTFQGAFQTMETPDSLNLPLILSKTSQGYSLYAFLNGHVFYQKDFEARYSNLISGNNETYWIINDQIYTLQWRQQ